MLKNILTFVLIVVFISFFSSIVRALPYDPDPWAPCRDADGGRNFYVYSCTRYDGFEYDGRTWTGAYCDFCNGHMLNEFHCNSFEDVWYPPSVGLTTIEPEDKLSVEPIIIPGIEPREIIQQDYDSSILDALTPDYHSQQIQLDIESGGNEPGLTMEPEKFPPRYQYGCPLSCSGGKCVDRSPVVELSAYYKLISDGGGPSGIYASCRPNSGLGLASMSLSIQGFSLNGELSFSREYENNECAQYPANCNEIRYYPLSSDEIWGAIPGNWEITCSAVDSQGSSDTSTKTFSTGCDGAFCRDAQSPIIWNFDFTSIRPNLHWLYLHSTDALSGTDYMDLRIYYKAEEAANYYTIDHQLVDCPNNDCRWFSMYIGSGYYKAQLTVADQEGNEKFEEIEYNTQGT